MDNVTTIDFRNGNHQAPAIRSKIEATALELFSRFAPCRRLDFEFTPGTVLAKLHIGGRLEEAHLRAAQQVIADLECAVGRSDVHPNMSNDAADRLRLLIDETLTTNERLLLIDLFVNDYFQRAHKSERLPEIGRLLSGYQGKPQATSAAVGRVQALLERIAAYYADL